MLDPGAPIARRRRRRPVVALVAVVVVAVACAGCGASSGDAKAERTTTTAAASTTAAPESTSTTATTATTDTTEGAATTTLQPGSGGLPSCPDVLQQYTDAFTPDDLAPVVALFRQWAPHMPDEVAAAVLRIADAYEKAGSLGKMNLADQDLTADAETFSNWTNEGCPAG